MRREVLLTLQAEGDIDSILAWLGDRSPRGARSWFSALETALAWLGDNADRCAVAPENDRFEETVQERLFKTRRGRRYRILFTIHDLQVRVLQHPRAGPRFDSPLTSGDGSNRSL